MASQLSILVRIAMMITFGFKFETHMVSIGTGEACRVQRELAHSFLAAPVVLRERDTSPKEACLCSNPQNRETQPIAFTVDLRPWR